MLLFQRFKEAVSFLSRVRSKLLYSFLAEIPLFHVLNARITFGSVNKCSTEAEVRTTPAGTPTSTGEDEEAAGGAATCYTSSFHIYIYIYK